jgi:uncharacterized protein YaaN involved in tellurite resistance
MKQQELFEEWQFVSQKILDLKSFVQNNFDEMIADGYIEKDEIEHSISKFENLFEKNVSELIKLKDYIVLFMKKNQNKGHIILCNKINK